MQPKHVLASVFLAGGAWALLAPAHVIHTCLLRPHVLLDNPEVADAATLFVACFGVQAVMCGALFLTAVMTRAVYVAFSVGMLPFFVLFNYRYLYVKPMFNAWMWADVAGSAVILVTCLWGLQQAAGPPARRGKGRAR